VGTLEIIKHQLEAGKHGAHVTREAELDARERFILVLLCHTNNNNNNIEMYEGVACSKFLYNLAFKKKKKKLLYQ
jgi:hypothetical protein